MQKARVSASGFNLSHQVELPYGLTAAHLALAMEMTYSALASINRAAAASGGPAIEEWANKATLSALVSASLCRALGTVSETLTTNARHGGHPALLVAGRHRNDACGNAHEGIEIKVTTRGHRVCVATAPRVGWYLVVGLSVDGTGARPTYISDLYLARLTPADFVSAEQQTTPGTRTRAAHIGKRGGAKLRAGRVYHAARPF